MVFFLIFDLQETISLEDLEEAEGNPPTPFVAVLGNVQFSKFLLLEYYYSQWVLTHGGAHCEYNSEAAWQGIKYCIVPNRCPGGVAIFQKGGVY